MHKYNRARDYDLCQSEADRSTGVSGAFSRSPGRRAATRERFLSSAAMRLPGVEEREGRLWLPGPHLEPRYRRRRNDIARSCGESVKILWSGL